MIKLGYYNAVVLVRELRYFMSNAILKIYLPVFIEQWHYNILIDTVIDYKLVEIVTPKDIPLWRLTSSLVPPWSLLKAVTKTEK